jgi:dethiobiotin synthetase
MRPSSTPPFEFDVSSLPPLPPARGLFVTGTDTGVGKTIVAGAIARRLRQLGRPVEVLKPVATGCRRGRGGLISDDADFLAACADSRHTLADIAPVRYAPAVAPNVAAELTGRPVDLQAVFRAYRRLADEGAEIVVEGIGGLLCPVTDALWVAHLARLMALPVIVVARASLGTINHTLLMLHAARSAQLRVAGVVLNRYRPEAKPTARRRAAGDDDLAMHTNPAQIARLGGVPVLAMVPDEPANSLAKARLGENTRFAVSQVDWEQIIAG